MVVSSESLQSEQLCRLMMDNALDAFIAFDEHGRIIEWSRQAEKTFGWVRDEVLGLPLQETILPERYRQVHFLRPERFVDSGESPVPGRRIEMTARCKDGSEIPVELTITPINMAGRLLFSASVRSISWRKELEEEVQKKENITNSILDSMAVAVAVADLSERIILVNDACQRLLRLRPADQDAEQTMNSFTLYKPDGKTPFEPDERPIAKALQGMQVNDMVGFIRHAGQTDGVWVSMNARPLIDSGGMIAGAVMVYHDITELRRRQETLALQARMLQEQASLLDLAHDAIMVRDADGIVTYWNLSAEKMYGFSKEEAIGQHGHALLATRFPDALDHIQELVRAHRIWEGEVVQTTKDGREITVFSKWTHDIRDGHPPRYLETNTDITQRIQTERALRQSQENYRMLVEASIDYAIIMIDADGIIMSWNAGAEKVLGLSPAEAIGQPAASLFTPEDRHIGEPQRELTEARVTGRSEGNRWHSRRDGTRFWASGVVTPVWNEDGSLHGYVKIMRDQTSGRLLEEQTQFLANHDALTGLANRVSLSQELHQAIARSERTQVPFAILLLDLDKFKHVNDTFGHHVGDLMLREVALRILSSIRETDFVARLGGDEFVVMQADAAQPEAAEILARKLVLELGRPYLLDSCEIISGTSIGLASYPMDAKSSVELLKRADLALYRAKSAGRGTYQIYSADLFSERAWKKDREQALRDALVNHQFELYYQPQIDLDNWKISTVEALLRWQASDLEVMLPAEFLAVAEESGIIVEIGEWALRQACRQVRKWQSQGLTDLRISVNCSARQFRDPRFVKSIQPILRESGLKESCLELEITESMLAQHPEVKQQLTELRTFGVRVTIDNYGTGTTALIDLKEFEVDSLKIDKAFVQHLPHRRKDSAITAAIISLAHNLGIGVSAGGVETAEQLAYLKSQDCTSAQGFIFSPPLPAAEFEALMLSGRWSRINRSMSPLEPVSKDMH